MMMPTSAGTPLTARTLGLGDGFRYWRGVSGRRYLFSAVPADAIDGLSNVVVIEAADPQRGCEPAPVWLGEVDGLGARNGYALGRTRGGGTTRTFVHFPAGSDTDRHSTMLDLAGGQA
ncbi:MAG: hypothetical protein P4L82_21685 [Ancalomicrobiaceae bacterium]|nr:hypothetical protein [Ancalomicrobiaceae bacterium]